MKNNFVKISNSPRYSLQDITIVPAEVSNISSRKECNTQIENPIIINREIKMYPIFTSPMASVIDDKNFEKFNKCGINTIIPRNVDFKKRISLMTTTFVAVSLKEAEYLIEHKEEILSTDIFFEGYVCIDIANGHMSKLFSIISDIKAAYGDSMIVMSGNIANPKTYEDYYRVGCDYVRCGIGTGSQCVTTSNVSIHYPIASLIDEINGVKKHLIEVEGSDDKLLKFPKIILDGGIKNFDDINKALGLGADFVMIGKLFAECAEACSTMYYYKKYYLDLNTGEPFKDFRGKYSKETVAYSSFDKCLKEGKEIYREYYGMSTTIAQLKIDSSAKLKQSEGISSEVKVKYHLEKWVELFDAYLKSCMSYCNSTTIEEFKENAEFVLNSNFTVIDYASKRGEYR